MRPYLVWTCSCIPVKNSKLDQVLKRSECSAGGLESRGHFDGTGVDCHQTERSDQILITVDVVAVQQFASVSEHASLGGGPLWSDVGMTAV